MDAVCVETWSLRKEGGKKLELMKVGGKSMNIWDEKWGVVA